MYYVPSPSTRHVPGCLLREVVGFRILIGLVGRIEGFGPAHGGASPGAHTAFRHAQLFTRFPVAERARRMQLLYLFFHKRLH